ncbi:transmembrane protein 19 isoform X2 [Zootermopsis nevadensis]|uniref:transmembrane protein 19 isoform X2 n=1 Tax=Zootermopsis nevadensis TaxID=136037 RepID=UPI000B8E4395|nr:transmembrane protein 19 isoform X2 [Zootermopsis nevadensis]
MWCYHVIENFQLLNEDLHFGLGGQSSIYRMTVTNLQRTMKENPKAANLLPVLICAVALPLSMTMWIGNLAFSFFAGGENSIHHEDGFVIPPTRWFISLVTPLAIAAWGIRKNSLVVSGAVLGFFVGFILTLTSYSFLMCLMTFFVTSSKLTKFRSEQKRSTDEDFKEGGQRSWVQVLSNGGMATQLAFLYMLDSGCGERPINFIKDYRASWLGLGVLGALACSNGDTWASELGTVIGRAEPFLITSRQRVPRGTNGGVTIAGLFFSLLGGTVVGLSYYLSVLYFVDSTVLAASPPQWPLVFAGSFAGLVGSLVDSVLGATLQYSGLDERTGCVVEHAGKGIRYISGVQILDNNSVNLITTIVMGLLTPRIANMLWP